MLYYNLYDGVGCFVHSNYPSCFKMIWVFANFEQREGLLDTIMFKFEVCVLACFYFHINPLLSCLTFMHQMLHSLSNSASANY